MENTDSKSVRFAINHKQQRETKKRVLTPFSDGKLSFANSGNDWMYLQYDAMGNRVYKESYADANSIERQYIVDIAGELPTILCEIDPNDCSLKNSYFYGSNAQVLCQLAHGVDPNTLEATVDKYFYLHDRLGSVRQMIDDTAAVVNSYTYDPYGNAFAAETTENAYNPFRFTGQWYDAEIDQYYLREELKGSGLFFNHLSICLISIYGIEKES